MRAAQTRLDSHQPPRRQDNLRVQGRGGLAALDHRFLEASRDYFARFQTSLYGLPTPVWV
jgi:hypothetical protein